MKTVFITGATRNTGLAIARRFAREGWNVAISSRDTEVAKATVRRLTESSRHLPLACTLRISSLPFTSGTPTWT